MLQCSEPGFWVFQPLILYPEAPTLPHTQLHLELVQTVQAREVLQVPSADVEAGTMPGAAHPATRQHTWEGQCKLRSLARAPLQSPSTPWPFHTAQETPPIDEKEAQEGAKLAWGLVELGCEPF